MLLQDAKNILVVLINVQKKFHKILCMIEVFRGFLENKRWNLTSFWCICVRKTPNIIVKNMLSYWWKFFIIHDFEGSSLS